MGGFQGGTVTAEPDCFCLRGEREGDVSGAQAGEDRLEVLARQCAGDGDVLHRAITTRDQLALAVGEQLAGYDAELDRTSRKRCAAARVEGASHDLDGVRAGLDDARLDFEVLDVSLVLDDVDQDIDQVAICIEDISERCFGNADDVARSEVRGERRPALAADMVQLNNA